MEKRRDWEQRIVDYSADLMDKHFPKGECKERGKALVFNAKLITYVMGELDKAREEGYQNCMDDIWEKARGLRSWTEHDGSVSAGDIEAGLREAYLEIEEELSKLTNK